MPRRPLDVVAIVPRRTALCPHCGMQGRYSWGPRLEHRVECRCAGLVLPPTRTHYQLALLLDTLKLVTYHGDVVEAEARQWKTSTDRVYNKVRFPGKGRNGLRLTLRVLKDGRYTTLLEHTTGEMGRTHAEAREWVRMHLRSAASFNAFGRGSDA